MCVINVQNLTKTYGGFTAVNHVSFSVEKGTMLGFLGINGAGKTTIINMLATLLTPDSGHVEICGEELGKSNQEIRRKIGIVYQQNCLDDMLSVQENLICRGIIHGAPKAGAKRQCARLGEILKLGDLMKKKYRMLSGGQKRRCEIAAALMHTPEILFLDEPTTGLDPATRLDVWSIISRLQKEEKMTVFLTTHYMEEAAGADKIIILDRGSIVTQGTPFALKEKYAMDKLRLFYGPGEADGRRLTERLAECGIVPGKGPAEGGTSLEIPLPSTMEALPVLAQVKGLICGFEVILGNMDDVFLNAVGRELTHQAAGCGADGSREGIYHGTIFSDYGTQLKNIFPGQRSSVFLPAVNDYCDLSDGIFPG